MALMHLNFTSKCLAGATDVNIILPDCPMQQAPGTFYGSGKKYPVLWLLHGSFDDCSAWVRRTNVELYACEKELIVVMPSALNTDYANWPGFGMGHKMFDFLTEELMPLVYSWLPVSTRREDNFLAGLSMGGRGALAYAYRWPEKFAAVYCMSFAPVDMRVQGDDPLWAKRNENRLANAGGLEGYLASPQNTWDGTRAAAADPAKLPKLYFSCGTADVLMYESFKRFRTYARQVGLPAAFIEGEGYNHEWRFWEKCIQDALQKFLPDAKQAGRPF